MDAWTVQADPKKVADILDRLEQAGDRAVSVKVGELTQSLGERSLGPFLLIPAMLDISPLGTIPGLPTTLAAILFLFSAQVAMGRKHLWLPSFVEGRKLSSDRLRKSVDRLRPIGLWMDRWFHGRLAMLTTEPFVRATGVVCMALALSMPPLEIVPFATTLATAPIAVFGLAFLFRDGLLMIVGFATAAAAGAGLFWFFMG